MYDPPKATDALIDGLPATLPVATPGGWRLAGHLQVGDLLCCVDDAPQPVRHLTLNVHRGWAVQVPALALGNPGPVTLPPDQPVALDLDQAALFYGDPVALIPARALIGWRGIAPCAAPADPLIRIALARRQVIHAGPGLLLGTLGVSAPALRPEGPPGPPLTPGQARHLMACVMAEEIGTALGPGYAALRADRP